MSSRSEKAFQERFKNWRKKRGYRYNEKKAAEINAAARSCVCPMPKTDETRLPVEQAVSQIRASSKAPVALDEQMRKLAETLPEYPVVMEMHGVGPRLGPQLMGGDWRCPPFPFQRRSGGLCGR